MWASAVTVHIWMKNCSCVKILSITSCEPIIICLKYKGEVLSVVMLKICVTVVILTYLTLLYIVKTVCFTTGLFKVTNSF